MAYYNPKRSSYRKKRSYKRSNVRRRLTQSAVATALIPRDWNAYTQMMQGKRKPIPRTSAAKVNLAPKRSVSVQTTAVGTQTDGYNQMTIDRIRTGYKPKTTLSRLTKEVRQRSETTIYRFQGLKSFDDNGYYFASCGLDAASTKTLMPCYIYDLTAIQNVGTGGSVVGAQPLRRATWNLSTSNIGWDTISGIQNDGTTTNSTILVEKRPTASTLSFPHEKSRLLWTDVKMNLWGTQNKPTEWTIQLVKFYDDNFDPWNTPTNQVEHTTFWQSQLKHYVYNPIATTSQGIVRRGMKVLKSYSKVIQPTANYENDPDPHAVTLKWFSKWYRDISYKNGGRVLDGDIGNTILAPDFISTTTSEQNKEYTDTKHKIFLLIRAKVFQRQDMPTVNNTVSPSFDLVVRTCHETQ